jgi:hypothetical protein
MLCITWEVLQIWLQVSQQEPEMYSLPIGVLCRDEALYFFERRHIIFIYLSILDTCIAHYPRVSSKRFTFIHTTGYAT